MTCPDGQGRSAKLDLVSAPDRARVGGRFPFRSSTVSLRTLTARAAERAGRQGLSCRLFTVAEALPRHLSGSSEGEHLRELHDEAAPGRDLLQRRELLLVLDDEEVAERAVDQVEPDVRVELLQVVVGTGAASRGTCSW